MYSYEDRLRAVQLYIKLGKRRPAAARRWVGLRLLVLLLLGWRAAPGTLMHWLETRYAPASQGVATYAGVVVVVLGGSFERASVRHGHDQIQTNAHAERITEAVALARAHPDLPVIFTGSCVDTGEVANRPAPVSRAAGVPGGLGRVAWSASAAV